MIKDAINSILFSDIPKDKYEIILVDNNSTDNTIEVCKEYGIKYINNPIQMNQSKSRNDGIKEANGEYVIFLDGDDYLNTLYLNEIAETIESNKHIDVFFPNRLIGLIDDWSNVLNNISINLDKHQYACGISHYICKTKFLIDNNIFFEEEKFFYYTEDFVFFSNLYLFMNNDNTMGLYNDWFYFGIKRHTSTYINKTFDKSMIQYFIDMGEYVRSFGTYDIHYSRFINKTIVKMLNIVKKSMR